jgi:hypothetical protein
MNHQLPSGPYYSHLNDLSSSPLYAVEISYGATCDLREVSETAEGAKVEESAIQENLAKAFEEHKQLHLHWKSVVQ